MRVLIAIALVLVAIIVVILIVVKYVRTLEILSTILCSKLFDLSLKFFILFIHKFLHSIDNLLYAFFYGYIDTITCTNKINWKKEKIKKIYRTCKYTKSLMSFILFFLRYNSWSLLQSSKSDKLEILFTLQKRRVKCEFIEFYRNKYDYKTLEFSTGTVSKYAYSLINKSILVN